MANRFDDLRDDLREDLSEDLVLFGDLVNFLDNPSMDEREEMSNDPKAVQIWDDQSASNVPNVQRSRNYEIDDRRFDVSNGDVLVLERFRENASIEVDWPQFIGKAIRMLRLCRSTPMTQEELATLAGRELESIDGYIDQSYVSRVEAGTIRPTWKRLTAFARALGTTVSRIVWEAERTATFHLSQTP